MVRFRVTDELLAHVNQAWKDAGYANLSAYLRAVLLERTVVTVADTGVVIIPAAGGSTGHDEAVKAAFIKAFAELAGSGDAHSGPASTSPGEDASPPDGMPPAGSADPGSGKAPPYEPDDVEETCPRCGRTYPASADTHHSELECTENLEADRKCGSCGAHKDGPHEDWCPTLVHTMTPEELGRQPREPVGGPQEGEGLEVFTARRIAELQALNRPTIVARAEAESEWRRFYEEKATGTTCQHCGCTRSDASKPCPDCGAAPQLPIGGTTP